MLTTVKTPADARSIDDVQSSADQSKPGDWRKQFVADAIRFGHGVFRYHVRACDAREPRPCSLRLPGPDSGLSPLACQLVRRSYSAALELNDRVFPVEEYAGPEPIVAPVEVFFVAGDLCSEGAATPAEVLRATRAALKFFDLA